MWNAVVQRSIVFKLRPEVMREHIGRVVEMGVRKIGMQVLRGVVLRTPVDTGRASAIYSTQRQVAAALGVAMLGSVLVSRTNTHGALSGFRAAFLVGTVLIVLAAATGLLIRDEDAASTIRRPG